MPEFKEFIYSISFTLSQTDKIVKIVFEKITFPMAQVLSFFNAIIILSYLGVAVSESKIIEEFMSLRLKYFYGETYLKMKENQ
jgi:hypothetical protein